MGWRYHLQVLPDNTVHTWPEDDDAHLVDPGDKLCWCKPQLIEYDNGNIHVIHRDALDRLPAA